MVNFLMIVMSVFVLTWTAPGDDGYQGQAVSYDIRMSTTSITAENWESCVQIPNAPLPMVAGTPQACTVWFAMTATDEAGNESGLSNVAISTTAIQMYPCADVNGDGGSVIDIADLVYLIDYMFRDGPPPNCNGE